MRRSARLVLLATGVAMSAACAQLQIYSDPRMTQASRTGIPFYVSRPYLLVARTGAKDNPVQVSVVYLPDLQNPLYARIVPGIGSSKTTLAFTNSVLASVGQESDAQVDELLTAFGGLQESLATAGLTRRQADLLRPEAAPDYVAVAQRLENVARDLAAQAVQARQANLLTTQELATLDATVTVLNAQAAILRDPTQAERQLPMVIVNLENAARAWDGQIREASTSTTGIEPGVRRQLVALRAQLREAISTLKGGDGAPAPVFEMYEIDNSQGRTVLRRVASE